LKPLTRAVVDLLIVSEGVRQAAAPFQTTVVAVLDAVMRLAHPLRLTHAWAQARH